jgi:twitching motility protein PilT
MRDPICGMDIDAAQAEEAGLYADEAGVRYHFCAPACRDVFQMDPIRRGEGRSAGTGTGRCELCHKAIGATEVSPTLSLRGTTYRFCCPTCAAVFADPSALDGARTSAEVRPPDTPRERLQQTGVLPWLEQAVRENASDLFLSVGHPPTLKIYGTFKRLPDAVLSADRVGAIVRQILPESKRARFEEGREVDLGLAVDDLARFRVNVFLEQGGEAIAFRPLPWRIPTLDELGLPPVIRDLTRLARGLVLVTGPTGSGKTTSLAAFIDCINQRDERHIITIEDPIEYVLPSRRALVHQREVGLHTRSFADGLRAALREHPDVIVIGELRDLESITLAIRAAETGHLVLGTLHTGDTSQAMTRLLDVFDAASQNQIRIQLAQSLQAVIAQRLLRRRDGRGMVAATEVLIATPAVRNVVRQNRIAELRTYLETGGREGMHTLEQSVEALLQRGLVGPEARREIAAGAEGYAAPPPLLPRQGGSRQ